LAAHAANEENADKAQQCQKAAWSLFHKDECKILKKSPTMMAQHLMTHRLIFWQQRGLLPSVLANSLMRLETHFHEFNKEPVRATALFKAAQTIRESTGRMVNQNVPWKFIPLVCSPILPGQVWRVTDYPAAPQLRSPAARKQQQVRWICL
jgi:hypothetical protein